MNLATGKLPFLALNKLLLRHHLSSTLSTYPLQDLLCVFAFWMPNLYCPNSMPFLRNVQCIITFVSKIFVVPLFRKDTVSQPL